MQYVVEAFATSCFHLFMQAFSLVLETTMTWLGYQGAHGCEVHWHTCAEELLVVLRE